MVETIIGFIVMSGVLGLVANILVSFVKKFREMGIGYVRVFSPRTWAALSSLTLVLATVLAGGEADLNEVTQYLEVLVYSGSTWLSAHLIHRANSI